MSYKRIMVSGGFDPVHIGHIRMIRAAAEFGPVVVVANSDDWLMRKKGYVFMPWAERAEILESIKGVVAVVKAKDDEQPVVSVKAEETMKSVVFADEEHTEVLRGPVITGSLLYNVCHRGRLKFAGLVFYRSY